MRRAFNKATGLKLASSSFQKRFTPGLVRMLKKVLDSSLDEMIGIGRQLKGVLASFRGLVLTDSTVIRLNALLEDVYPGSRKNHSKAAVKAHAVFCVRGAGKQSVKLTPGKRNDGPVFTVGPWIAGKLLLFDLGYFSYRLFASIRRNKGFFISRLKGKVDPVIVAEHRVHRGRAIEVVGRKLREVVEKIGREILDVEVEVEFKRRKYGDKARRDTQRLRVVGVRDEATGDYHLYITNVPPDRLTPEDVARTYAARWLVEHLFLILKSHYRLEDMPSARQVVVEALLYAALITAVVGDRLLDAVRKKLKGVRIPMIRWGVLLASQALDILLLMTRAPRETKLILRLVSAVLLDKAPDPNVNRISLLEAVETGQHPAIGGSPRERGTYAHVRIP